MIKYIYILILIIIASCELSDEYKDSKRPEYASVGNVYTAAQIECARLIDGEANNKFMLLAQQFANINYPRNDRYFFAKTQVEAIWEQIYVDVLANLNDVIFRTKDGYNDINLTSRILRAWAFSIATDLFGDVPYTEASTVVNDMKNILPAYDYQKDIYLGIMDELKYCSEMLSNNTSENLKEYDLIYSGDLNKWKKFANSLYLRLNLRISDVEPEVAKDNIEYIFNNSYLYPLFESNDDNSQFQFLIDISFRGKLYSLTGYNNYYCISKNFIDLLKSFDDPRIEIFAQPAISSTRYNGQENGGELIGSEKVSQIGKIYLDNPDYKVFFMTFSEVCFIKAELLNKGYSISGEVENEYYKGVESALAQFGLSHDYLSHDSIKYNIVNADRQIALQKYIAYFPQGVQAFSHYRRTGFPKTIKEAPKSYYPGKGVPVRFPYPEIEINANSKNISPFLEGIENGMFGKKLWWDID